MNIIEEEELKRRRDKMFSISYDNITNLRKNKQKFVSMSIGRMMGRSIKQVNLAELRGSHLHVVHQLLIHPTTANSHKRAR